MQSKLPYKIMTMNIIISFQMKGNVCTNQKQFYSKFLIKLIKIRTRQKMTFIETQQ